MAGDSLTPEAVTSLYRDCLAPAGDPRHIEVEGIVSKTTFSQPAIAVRTAHIKALLMELPGQFRKSEGGGWSFLNACLDYHGRQWTGEHAVMEQLFMLGMAAALVTCMFDRDLWEALPGGMPYYRLEF